MEQHIRIVAILHIVMGVIFLVTAVAIFVFGAGAVFLSDDPDAAIVGSCIGGVSILIAILSLPSILAGWGLQRRKQWARILTIILAVLNLFNFPLGTALGAYSLWALLNEQSKNYFV